MLESPNLSKIAYENILKIITSGEIKLGSQVSQNAISRKLPMSRTPVREALFALESQGLIEKNGTKYYVSYVSKEEVMKLYEARKILEGNSARICAENIDAEGKKKLQLVLRKLKILSESNSATPDQIAAANGNLHQTIAELSGNMYLSKFIMETLLKLRILRISLLISQDRRVEEYKDHQQIVEHIINGDGKTAQAAMEAHEDAVLEFAQKTVFKKFYVD